MTAYPEREPGLGHDRRGSRRPVDQRQLPEAPALTDGGHGLVVDPHLDLPLVDDVEVVPLVPLLDDDVPRLVSLLEERVGDGLPLLRIEVAEEQVGVEHAGQGVPGPSVLRNGLTSINFLETIVFLDTSHGEASAPQWGEGRDRE